MSLSFYDTSVASYLQIIDATAACLEKGAHYASENGIDLQQIVTTRLREDMMPFHFQIIALTHMSVGSIRAMQSGTFSPPSFEIDKSYEELQGVVADSRSELAELKEADVEALAEGSLIFKMGKNEIPFTHKNFLISFALPNFYFHSTTTYDILRMLGVPLGKMDFLGQLKIGG